MSTSQSQHSNIQLVKLKNGSTWLWGEWQFGSVDCEKKGIQRAVQYLRSLPELSNILVIRFQTQKLYP